MYEDMCTLSILTSIPRKKEREREKINIRSVAYIILYNSPLFLWQVSEERLK